MWSLGCLIYELYSRRTLLPGENTIDQITKMIEFKGKPTPSEIESFQLAKANEILSFFNVSQQPI
jgi:serine/threonine protein kinase